MPKLTKSYFHLSQVCQLKKLMEWMPSMIWFSSVMPIVCLIFNLKFLEMFKVNQSVGYRRPGPKSGITMGSIIVNRADFSSNHILAFSNNYLWVLFQLQSSLVSLFPSFAILQIVWLFSFYTISNYFFSCVGFSLVSSNWNMPFYISCTLNLEDQGGWGSLSVC